MSTFDETYLNSNKKCIEIKKKLLYCFKWMEKTEMTKMKQLIEELKRELNDPLDKRGIYRESVFKEIAEEMEETFTHLRDSRGEIADLEEKLKIESINYNSL
jgi:hypothetical protein